MIRRIAYLVALTLTWACSSSPSEPPSEPSFDTLSITTSSLPSGEVGIAYSQTVSASGGDGTYSWTITAGSLPAGITLGAANGSLSGTPTADGTATFTLGVSSGDGQSAARELSIAIAPEALPPLAPSESCSGQPGTREATFTDGGLADAIRAALGLGVGAAFTCADLAGLTSLASDSAGITDLAGLQNLSGLDSLSLTGNPLSDVTLVGSLTTLTYLDLSTNAIVDVGPIAALTGLDELQLAENQIPSIDTLATLTGLTEFHASYNTYSSIAALAAMTGLVEVDINDNVVSDLSPLAGLTSLEVLDLDRNTFTSLAPLAGLTALRVLDFDDNAVADLSPLAGLTALTLLEASNIDTGDISALSALVSLEWLELWGNDVIDVSVIENMTALSFLNLSGNGNLTDIQPLLNNAGLGAGDEIDLDGTGANCFDVFALEDRGATVDSDCVRPVLQPLISNGADFASRGTYWTAPVGTTGPALTVQIFDDGTGQIAYDNDAFQPPVPLATRTLYSFTWTETSGDIVIVFSGANAAFGNVRNIVGTTSFEADFDDGTNQSTFVFTYFVGADPPR